MIDDNKIKDICRTSSAQGIRLIMDTYQESLYNHVRRLLVNHEDAQDALQETFIAIYRNLEKFRFESSLSTWLYRIATNECLRILDRRKREEMMTDEDLSKDLIGRLMASEYVDYEDEMAVKFQAAILALPEKQRLVFNMRYYDEMGYTEIAKVTGGTVETLKVNYHYAKDKIRDYILKH